VNFNRPGRFLVYDRTARYSSFQKRQSVHRRNKLLLLNHIRP
jgi:hypothetical protein